MPDSPLALDFPARDGWSEPVRLSLVEDESGRPDPDRGATGMSLGQPILQMHVRRRPNAQPDGPLIVTLGRAPMTRDEWTQISSCCVALLTSRHRPSSPPSSHPSHPEADDPVCDGEFRDSGHANPRSAT